MTPISAEDLHITRWGDSGPRLVLVHGSAQGSAIGGDRHFARQQLLSDNGWQVIVPDRPGHGLSPAPGRPDDAEADGALIADLLKDGAHLAGHSFGGCVALAAAAMRPEAVRSLTLIEPAMQMIALENGDVQKFGLKAMMAIKMSLSDASRARNFEKLVTVPEELRAGTSKAEQEKIGRGMAAMEVPRREVLMQQLACVRDNEIPLIVVTGGWSAAFDATGAKAAQLGGGRHVIIPSPHHFPHLVSDEFNQLVNTLN